jgi:hypothetical protein
MTEIKRCSKCGQIKPVEKFGKDKQKKDGFCSACKTCRRKGSLQPLWAEENIRKHNKILLEVS